MASLVVIVAPRTPSAGAVREVLRDLSAVETVRGFLWIEPPMIEGSRVSALAVSEGSLSVDSLSNALSRARWDRVRVVVLVPALDGATVVPPDVEQEIVRVVEAQSGGAPVTRARVIMVAADDPSTTAELAQIGWHNIVVAPEDGMGPGLGYSIIHGGADPLVLAGHGASALAGLAGLWGGIDESPLDQLPIDPGASVRVSRGYFRQLQGDALEAVVRARVTATADVLPLPLEGSSRANYVEDHALATGAMAKALWARHPAVLRGPRERPIAAKTSTIGFLDAVKMFFGFLWAALRNAPMQWMQSVITSVSSRAAGMVHGMVFGGAPSAYAVVVGGVTANGLPASWIDLVDAADELEDALDGSNDAREHHVLSDHTELWEEYVAGALTLADAGDREQGLPPIQVGTQRAIVRDPNLIVPSRTSRFDAIPAHIAARIDISHVEAFDVLAVNNLHLRLQQLHQESTIGREVGAAIDDLTKWNREFRGSYAAKVGSALGESIVGLAAEIRTILEQLKAAAAQQDIGGAVAAQQKKLSLILRIMAIVAVVVSGVVVGLWLGSVISALVATILLTSAFLGWLVSSLVAFFRGQRELFRMMTARQQLVDNSEALKRNLQQALRDLRRAADAYAQFLAWSRVLSAVLVAPLGTVAAASNEQSRIDPRLPSNVKLGAALADEATVAQVVVSLRRDVFRVGWLTQPWESLLRAAPSLLGPEAFDLRDEPRRLFGMSAADDSPLTRWVEIVGEHGVNRSVADGLWERVRTELAGDNNELASGLLSSIVTLGDSHQVPRSYDDFMAGIDDAAPASRSGTFAPVVFAVSSQATAPTAVDIVWSRAAVNGLSRVATLIQLTAGAPPFMFAAYREATRGTPNPASTDPYLPSGPSF